MALELNTSRASVRITTRVPHRLARHADAITARLRALLPAFGITDPEIAEWATLIDVLLSNDTVPSGTRAVIAITAVTGCYPPEEQVRQVQPWLDVGETQRAYEMILRFARRTPRRALSRLPLRAPSIVVDVTRTGRATSTSGIPRVARAVALAAVDRGGATIAWAGGAPGLVTVQPDGTLDFASPARPVSAPSTRMLLHLKRSYWWLLNRLARHGGGQRLAMLARSVVGPVSQMLFDHAAHADLLILDRCHYVLPEVPMKDTSTRLIAQRAGGAPFELTIAVHDLLPINAPRFFHPGQRLEHLEFARLVCTADHIIVASPHVRAEVEGLHALFGMPLHRPVEVVPYGGGALIWHAGLAPRTARPEAGRTQFLMVGSMEDRKNHALMLRALGLLARQGLPTTLHMIGAPRPTSEDTRRALAYARSGGVTVVEHGVASDEDIGRIAADCTALCYPSFSEGYGLPVLEALSLGLPVVASDIPSNRVHAGLGGVVLVAPDSPRELAHELRRIIEDDEAYDRLVSSIRKHEIPDGFAPWVEAVLGGYGTLGP